MRTNFANKLTPAVATMVETCLLILLLFLLLILLLLLLLLRVAVI
jgi:hypothetical protein